MNTDTKHEFDMPNLRYLPIDEKLREGDVPVIVGIDDVKELRVDAEGRPALALEALPHQRGDVGVGRDGTVSGQRGQDVRPHLRSRQANKKVVVVVGSLTTA